MSTIEVMLIKTILKIFQEIQTVFRVTDFRTNSRAKRNGISKLETLFLDVYNILCRFIIFISKYGIMINNWHL